MIKIKNLPQLQLDVEEEARKIEMELSQIAVELGANTTMNVFDTKREIEQAFSNNDVLIKRDVKLKQNPTLLKEGT